MRELPCPTCGAAIPFKSSVTLIAVCPYCASQVLRSDMNLESLGKVAELQADGSPLQLYATGTFDGDSFTVLGRMQLKFPEGFWNEWFIDFNSGRQGWLGEAQGLYAVSFKSESKENLPAFAALQVGRTLTLAGEDFSVRDLREASYLSAQGELPFRPPLGETAPLADLQGEGDRFATIDYSEKEPILFLGRMREFAQLNFSRLKELEGW